MTERRPDPDQLLRAVQAEERKKKRGASRCSSARRPASGRRSPCCRRPAGSATSRAATSWPAWSRRTAGSRRPRSSRASSGCPGGAWSTAARCWRSSTSTPRSHAGRASCSWTSSRTRTRRARATPKRWQDVEELLDAGIEVMTTLNIQHIESLNDVVAQITGVVVRETVPDSVLDMADEIKLVDLPPDELLERLREGKVYRPAQAERAWRASSARATSSPSASSRCARRPSASTPTWRRGAGRTASRRRGPRRIACSCASARARSR
jgi:hypothetical protein